MEFDNDRARKRPLKIELFYWVVFVFISPLVNGLTLFFTDIKMGLVLFNINLALLPAYLWYASEWVPALLFRKRIVRFIAVTAGFFAAILLFLWASYSFALQFSLTPAERLYFTWQGATVVRESVWIIIQLLLATAIAGLKLATEERALVDSVRKDNLFFKLRYLRAQLNPHFLFNTLNSIYSLSLKKSDKAPEMVVKLADLMRYLIYECNEEKISLDKEIAFIRNYIEIEKVRYKADIRFTVEGETKGVMLEPFLFIAFIENGFKHAMDNAFADPFIYITLKVEEAGITLNVINSTNAGLETQAKRINGKGISNSKSLLELLYPGSYKLDIIQTEREEARKSDLRILHAKERLEKLYPDSFALDVLLSSNTFTVSLILKYKMA